MKRTYYTRISAIIILFAAIVFPLPAVSAGAAAAGTVFRVISVSDGDTVKLRAESVAGLPVRVEQVRLIGIDAPELDQEPWGRRAKRHLKKMLSESNWLVTVELDLDRRDRYGRLLAYLWDRRGRMINEQMVEAGYAQLYTIPPNVKYAGRLQAAQQRAIRRGAGIWGAKGLRESPRHWRDLHPRGAGAGSPVLGRPAPVLPSLLFPLDDAFAVQIGGVILVGAEDVA